MAKSPHIRSMFVILLAGIILWIISGNVLWLAVCGIPALAGAFIPALGRLIHKGWLGFGHLMGRITGPVLLTVFYYLILTPVGIVSRIFSRSDPMRRRPPAVSVFLEENRLFQARDFEKTW